MLRTSITLSLTLLVFPACKKKEDSAGTSGATAETSGTTAAKPDEAKPAAAKPIEMEAPALFADYNKPGQDGMALLDKWRAGAIVTGTVTNTIAEENGFLHVWLDGGDKHRVTLDFTDQGKAAKDKNVKAGDKVTAHCQVGGSDGTMMMLIDCVLK